MKGLSPLISMVLVIAFGFTSMTIVLTVVNPLLDRAKDAGTQNEATQNMQLLDSAIKAVASEAQGSKRTIGIKITDGELRSDPAQDVVYLDFEPKSKNIIDGFAGDVKIESRPVFLEYFNEYADGNSASDAWTNLNGSWSISEGRLQGTGGIVYHTVGTQKDFELSGTVVNSVTPNGQIYIVPGNPRDLMMFLPFDSNDNTSMTIAYDFSPYRNNGTLVNGTFATCFTNNACPSWDTSGKFGNATTFDGIGDYVNLGNPGILNLTPGGSGELTISAWIKTSASSNMDVVSHGINGFVFYIGSGTVIFAQQNVAGNVASTTTVNDGNWHHVAVSYIGNSTATIYIDGVSAASSSFSRNFQHINNISIGRDPSAIEYFNGTIDEVMIFNRSLTVSEISLLYDSSLKKITTTAISQDIRNGPNITIVLASPGSSFFDTVRIKSGIAKIRFIIPYQKIDIANQIKIGPGDHNIVIEHVGLNTTTNRPKIQITS